jgi:hypothetical protein
MRTATIKLLVPALLAAITRCTPVSESCTGCISPAVSIVTVTSSGDTLLPARVIMISPDSSKVSIDTTESRVALYGPTGLYTVDLHFPDGGIIHLKAINAKQSTKMTCDHPVTENLLIRKTDALEKTSDTHGYEIIGRTSGGGCG